jgi:LysR family transcriptional regulator, nitrogen assimilation regulatory protein
METRYLRSFLKIAETGSITRAAEALGIAQPSLSQQLLRLEDEMGVHLFSRTARGVTLTDAGRLFQEHARQLLRSVDRAVEDIRHLDSDPVGTVILAVPYSISKLAGTALFEAMKLQAPHVRFRLVEAMTGQIWGWLEEGKVDLGILNYLGPKRGLSFRKLASEELYLVGPAGRFGTEQDMPDVALSELADLPMILPGQPHGLRQLIEHETARLGAGLKVDRDLDALAHLGGLIAAGHGYSILPLGIVADDLLAGRLSVARIEGGAMRRGVALVRNSGEIVTHASVRCEDVVREVLARLIADGKWLAVSDDAADS